MDMLIVGMYGKSHNSWIAAKGGCTTEEYKTHFSLWAMMNSPLMIGCDIRDMTEETKKILSDNRELLDQIAQHLLIKETITGDELMAFINKEE